MVQLQDLKSAVAARAEVRRANAKQRALQRANKAHQVDFAELKAAAYAAAKNRQQNNPQLQQQQRQTQQQQSLVSSGSRRRSGGEGAALQPVIMEYDQVKFEYFMVACPLLKGGALCVLSLT